jgi:hypothetical protein
LTKQFKGLLQLNAQQRDASAKYRTILRNNINAIPNSFPQRTLPAIPLKRDNSMVTTTIETDNNNQDTRQVHFGTKELIVINPPRRRAPYSEDFQAPTFDWNLHAHLLQLFFKNCQLKPPSDITTTIGRYFMRLQEEVEEEFYYGNDTTEFEPSDWSYYKM